MANKEYAVIEILDVLRRQQAGDGIRTIAKATNIARNTVRKYIRIAQEKVLGNETNADLEDIAYAVFREVHNNDNADDADHGGLKNQMLDQRKHSQLLQLFLMGK